MNGLECDPFSLVLNFVFGSALTRRFNKNSDIDFTVVFDKGNLDPLEYGADYFDLKFALEDLLQRDMDLVEYNAIRNPYFKAELDQTKQLIYGQ